MGASSTPAKILIGIPLDVDVSTELLSWAIRVAARPNDTVVAIHILVGKESSKKHGPTRLKKNQLRQAKAFVISMLGEYAHTCQSKLVNLEARVSISSSVGRGLIDVAESIGCTVLLVGGLRSQNPSQSSLEIAKYCFKRAPKDCSVVAIGIPKKPAQDSDTQISRSERSFHTSSKWSNNSHVQASDTISPLKKFFTATAKREKSFKKNKYQHSLTEIICEDPSPRAVLEGPKKSSQSLEDEKFSIDDSGIIESSPQEIKDHGRWNIWKNISPFRFFYPLFGSSFDATRKRRINSFSNTDISQPSWSCFSYEKISNATNNFHADNMVGRGGYSEVYRGDLCDGRTIAVKRLAKDNTDDNKQKEFLMELGILGHVCHPNTIHLIGCCFENGLHLIFEFSPNGNLSSALHGRTSKPLEWPIRYKIITGIARGLHYLHKGCKRRIIHRDIKASNILIGLDFEPQITDFGLAKWLPKQWTHHSVTPVEGTFGYLAPEYFMQGVVDEKTDVFAFGVLVLEIISGRRPVDSSKQSLLYWAKPLMESGDVEKLADPRLEGMYDDDQMRRLVQLASYCVRQSSLWRPSMTEVLQLLSEGTDEPEVGESWKMPESVVEEMDDYSMDFDSSSSTSKTLDPKSEIPDRITYDMDSDFRFHQDPFR